MTLAKTLKTNDRRDAENGAQPEGWAFACLEGLSHRPKSDIVDGPFGSNLKASEYIDNGVPVIRIQNVERNVFLDKNVRFVRPGKAEELRRHSFAPGDIVITKLGAPLGRTCLVPANFGPGIIVADVVRFRPTPELLSKEFLSYCMNSRGVTEQLAQDTKGTTRPRVNLGHIRQLRIPIPPLAEQKRIVAKVEALLARVNAARERLAKVPAILKRFRQSVLAAACSGRLTEDWREKSQEAAPADSLLEEPEKGALQPAGKRAGRLWGAGVVPPLTEEERLSIPETWAWAKVRDLGTSPEEAVQVGPMSMRSKDFAEDGVPVLNVGCVQWGWFDESKRNFLPSSIASGFSRYRIAKDDILFTRSGTVGRCATASVKQQGHLMTFHLLRVRPDQRKVLMTFLYFAFRGAPTIGRQTDEAAIGSTRAGFNTNLLAGLDIPLPPMAEQHEIVHRVEVLFNLADTIEQRVAAATARAEKLTQSILAKAFRGELVPTEAELARREGRDYEPASVLLDRIRAEREKAGPEKRTRAGRRAKPAAAAQAAEDARASFPTKQKRESESRAAPKSAAVVQKQALLEEEPPPRTETDGGPPPINEMERDERMPVIRQVFKDGQGREREKAIRDVARALGYGGASPRVRETLGGDLRAAVRRGVIWNDGGTLRIDCRGIDEYDREILKQAVLSVVGRAWWDREDAVRAAARHLGFARTGDRIEKAFNSTVRGLLRMGRLESDGQWIRATRSPEE
jgi:type I restriction enzyme S subunit